MTRPSVGFSIVCGIYGLTLAFFAWGFSTPPLDRVWQLHHELKIGQVYDLERSDQELLLEAMSRHPGLARALLSAGEIGIISAHRDGWIDTPVVTMIRTPRSSRVLRLVLDIQTPPQHIPYDVELTGAGWQRKLRVTERGVAYLELPPPPDAAELLTLRLDGKGLRPDPSSLGVRVGFDPPDEVMSESTETDDEDDE